MPRTRRAAAGCGDWLRGGLCEVLADYVRARGQDRLDSSHPLWRTFRETAKELEAIPALLEDPRLSVRWSIGQGAWARIPWLAVLDKRLAHVTSTGIYVIYLFRQDMSGLYLTLNQGISREKETLGAQEGRAVVRLRAAALRRRCGALTTLGFSLSDEIDLRTDSAGSADYRHGTVASYFYDRGALPPTPALLTHLEALLVEYGAIASEQPEG